MKPSSIPIFFAFLTLLMSSALADTGTEKSFQENLKLISAGNKQDAFIQRFVEISAKGNEEALFELVWEVSKNEFGEGGWRKYLKEQIIPYFKKYKSIDGYKNVSPLELMGSKSLVHFGYYRDKSGKRHPYEIIVVESNEKLFLGNIYVGRCIKGQHPVCE
jgi:hypothetical protein